MRCLFICLLLVPLFQCDISLNLGQPQNQVLKDAPLRFIIQNICSESLITVTILPITSSRCFDADLLDAKGVPVSQMWPSYQKQTNDSGIMLVLNPNNCSRTVEVKPASSNKVECQFQILAYPASYFYSVEDCNETDVVMTNGQSHFYQVGVTPGQDYVVDFDVLPVDAFVPCVAYGDIYASDFVSNVIVPQQPESQEDRFDVITPQNNMLNLGFNSNSDQTIYSLDVYQLKTINLVDNGVPQKEKVKGHRYDFFKLSFTSQTSQMWEIDITDITSTKPAPELKLLVSNHPHPTLFNNIPKADMAVSNNGQPVTLQITNKNIMFASVFNTVKHSHTQYNIKLRPLQTPVNPTKAPTTTPSKTPTTPTFIGVVPQAHPLPFIAAQNGWTPTWLEIGLMAGGGVLIIAIIIVANLLVARAQRKYKLISDGATI